MVIPAWIIYYSMGFRYFGYVNNLRLQTKAFAQLTSTLKLFTLYFDDQPVKDTSGT